jgi:hypothetical protein
MNEQLKQIKLKAIEIQDLMKTVDDDNAEILLSKAVDIAKEISRLVDVLNVKPVRKLDDNIRKIGI